MTPEQLDEIEARANQATEGPWVVTTCRCEHPGLKPSEHGVLATKTSGMLADFCESLNDENDAEFIATARTDIPQLVAEVRRLRSQTQQLLTDLKAATDTQYSRNLVIMRLRQTLGENDDHQI